MAVDVFRPGFFGFLFLYAWFVTMHLVAKRYYGTTVNGQVLDYYRSPKSKGGTGRRVRYSYHSIKYSYRWNDKTYKAQSEISGWDYKALPIGSSIEVRIVSMLPHLWPDPILSPRSANRSTKQILVGAVLSCLLVMLPSIWLYSAFRSRRLVQYGIATLGRIVEKRKLKDGSRSPDWRIVYEFSTDSGTVQRGSMRVEELQQRQVDEGNLVTILYDRYDPRRSVIYLLSCWKVVA